MRETLGGLRYTSPNIVVYSLSLFSVAAAALLLTPPPVHFNTTDNGKVSAPTLVFLKRMSYCREYKREGQEKMLNFFCRRNIATTYSRNRHTKVFFLFLILVCIIYYILLAIFHISSFFLLCYYLMMVRSHDGWWSRFFFFLLRNNIVIIITYNSNIFAFFCLIILFVACCDVGTHYLYYLP